MSVYRKGLGGMVKGTGDRRCPAWDGENPSDYMLRLAEHLGYKVYGKLEMSFKRAKERPYRERLEEIFRPREPGQEG